MKKIFSVLIAVFFLTALQAQNFTVDRTYGTACGLTLVSDINGIPLNNGGTKLIQTFGYPDGSVLSVYYVVGGVEPGIGLIKLTANGQLDPAFAGGGRTMYIPPLDNSTFRMPDAYAADTGGGKIVIVGPGGGGGQAWIMSFHEDGTFNYFHRSPGSSAIYAVAVQPDGQSVVLEAGSNGLFYVRRYAANSPTVDAAYGSYFGLPGNNHPIQIMGHNITGFSRSLWQSTGKPVFCLPGIHRLSNGADYNTFYLLRLNQDGTPDLTLGQNANPFVETNFGEPCGGLSLLPRGQGFRKAAGDKMRIVATTATCQAKVMQFDANGVVDMAWGSNGSVLLPGQGQESMAHDMYIDPVTDKSYIFGGKPSGALIWSLNADGSFNTDFNNGSSVSNTIFFYNHLNGSLFQQAVGLGPDRFLVTVAQNPGANVPLFAVISNKMLSISETPQCPNVVLSINQNTACFSLQWYRNGSPIPGATSATYTATTDGNYHVVGAYNLPAAMTAGTTISNVLNVVIPPPPTWYRDADGDTYGDPNNTTQACTVPSGYVGDNTDCDDLDPNVYPGATEVCNGKDDNCNGLIDEGFDTDTDGFTVCEGDCDDLNASINPGAIELCDHADNNCDAQIDEGVQSTFYRDADGDGYGNPNNSTLACSAPTGYVTDNTDCNDNAAAGGGATYPGADEVCNGRDDNCNGTIDEGVLTTFYADLDADGFGDAGNAVEACSQPSGYTTDASDCDDTQLLYADGDGDGYGTGATVACGVADNTDCDDAVATTNPDAAEACDGVDNNCNGTTDEGCNICNISVDAGADVSTFFGYSVTQTATRTAIVTGGTGTINYSWTLSRPLACNVVTSSGDESFTGGTCTDNTCGGTPSCSGASMSATLLTDAEVCVTVTDANGCTASDCFFINAEDARCFAGNSGISKVTVCHRTNSNTRPWVQICIAEAAVPAHLAEHSTDYVGKCVTTSAKNDESEIQEVFIEGIGVKAYPNPFSDKLNIEFTLPEDSKVKLEVLNVAGQLLDILFEGDVKAGEQNIYEYRSTDLAKGMVIYRLQTEQQAYYGKAVMMK